MAPSSKIKRKTPGIGLAAYPFAMISKTKKSWNFWLGSLWLLLFPSLAPGYEEVAVTNGGTISGFVKIQGKSPKLPPLEVLKNKELCKNVPNERLVAGPGQGVRYAVVTLEGITKGKAVEREAVHELDNLRCSFAPHVQAASIGQFLVIKNSDPILHTAHAYMPAGQPHFNVGLYPGKVSRKPLVGVGIVKIVCEVHPWMSAFIVVTEHPYYAVSDVYGEYLINDIPPGTYRLKVWHETLGTQEKEVRIREKETLQVDVNFSTFKGAKK